MAADRKAVIEQVNATFACDVYRFKGDRVAELTAFVINTDKTKAHAQARTEVGHAV